MPKAMCRSRRRQLLQFSPVRRGSVRLTMKFTAALPTTSLTVTVIAYAEFENVLYLLT